MAESTASLKAVISAYDGLKESGLTSIEQEIISITVSNKNECGYCLSMHLTVAEMVEMPDSTLTELRGDVFLSDTKLEALRHFTLLVMQNEGWVPEVDVEIFLNASYTKAHILDVILFIGFVSLSNYICHITGVAIDTPFSHQTWSSNKLDMP